MERVLKRGGKNWSGCSDSNDSACFSHANISICLILRLNGKDCQVYSGKDSQIWKRRFTQAKSVLRLKKT